MSSIKETTPKDRTFELTITGNQLLMLRNLLAEVKEDKHNWSAEGLIEFQDLYSTVEPAARELMWVTNARS